MPIALIFLLLLPSSICSLSIDQLTKHTSVPQEIPTIFKFVWSCLSKFYQLYTWVKQTSPINIIVILFITVYAIYMVISLARGLLARLFGSSREFNVETGLGEEVKDIQEQIKTVQKEIRDINKAIRLSREQAKKQIIQKQKEQNQEQNKQEGNEEQPDLYKEKMEKLQEKLRFNNLLESKILKGCQDMVGKLRRWNAKD